MVIVALYDMVRSSVSYAATIIRYRGMAAVAGFVGAAIYPFFQKRIGVWWTGQFSIIYQCILVAIAATPLFIISHEHHPYSRHGGEDEVSKRRLLHAGFVVAVAVVSTLLEY